MSTILFLDDMPIRHTVFKDLAARDGFLVDSAYTAEEAIRLLESHEYVGASLDHDLGEDHYMGPYVSPSMGGTAHSGRAVARWIAEHGKPFFVMIHSYNPDGAREMFQIVWESDHPLNVRSQPFNTAAFRTWFSDIHWSEEAKEEK